MHVRLEQVRLQHLSVQVTIMALMVMEILMVCVRLCAISTSYGAYDVDFVVMLMTTCVIQA